MKKGAVHRVLDKISKEVLGALLTSPELSPAVREYLTAWAGARVLITGKDLKSLGISPGPLYKKLLSALWDARLGGRVKDKEEEIRLVKALLKEDTDG